MRLALCVAVAGLLRGEKRSLPCADVCGADAECNALCVDVGPRLCDYTCDKVCAGSSACVVHCRTLQGRFCGMGALPEAELVPVPLSDAVLPVHRSVGLPSDFPRPVAPSGPVWREARVQSVQAVELLRAARAADGRTKLGSATLVRAWTHVGPANSEKFAGFKLCLRVPIAGEEHYLTVDTEPRAKELIGSERFVEIVRVDPEVDALGERVDPRSGGNSSFVAPPESQYLFPCHRHMSTLLNAPDVEHVAPARGVPSASAKGAPASYDSRAAFPHCAGRVGKQGSCSASAAFAVAAVASERLCIAATAHVAPETAPDVEQEQRAALHDQLLAAEAALDSSVEEVARLRQELKGLPSAPALLQRSAPAASDVPPLVELSAQELVSCGSARRAAMVPPFCLDGPGASQLRRFAFGCEGGSAVSALQYVHEYGLPTAECAPFVSGLTEHDGRLAPVCASLESKTCHRERELYKLGPPRSLHGVAAIQDAIAIGGAVVAQMDVRVDFGRAYPDNSPDGVYRVDAASPPIGRQAVVLHGWGSTSSGEPYWLGRGSWGTDWGLGGFFMIRRGTNEAGIEGDAYAADAVQAAMDWTAGSECVKVELSRGGCVLLNHCTSVRSVSVAYIGGAENCGTWRAEFVRVLPGRAHAETLTDAHLCAVERDEFVEDFDPGLKYVDVTAAHVGKPGQLATCVLHNTAASSRVRCCGAVCARAAPGSIATFPTKFCAAGCAGEGRQVYERVV